MYRGTTRGGDAAILRSYDSRKEPAPEYDCKIWEAGRATCAIGLAFKPIRIGQTVFHDDGSGTFNPSPYALDEATVNEWPGREVGVFISVGTGKRPKGTDQNSHVWYEGFMGEWAEARRNLISKVEGSELIHERMKKDLLMKRGVNIENYYRFNVEIGVGEFAMNEWDRLGEISTGTRRYLSRHAEQKMVQQSATKLAKIHRAKQRFDKLGTIPDIVSSQGMGSIDAPLAVELPGDMPMSFPNRKGPPSRESYESGIDHLSLPGNGTNTVNTPSSRSSGERSSTGHPSPAQIATRPPQKVPSPPALSPAVRPPPPDDEPDRLIVTAPTPAQYRVAAGTDKIAIMGADEYPRRQQRDPIAQPVMHPYQPHRIEPPPLPPKTPLPEKQAPGGRRPSGILPPYPLDDDGPPPVVNMARKPEYRSR